MDTSQATGRLTISRIPSGEAPAHVRRAWLGLTLPCFPVAGYLSGEEQLSTITHQPQDRTRACVIVPQAEALTILAKSDREAAEWWYDHGFPRSLTANFIFGLDEVTLVSGVTIQPLVEVTDEMQGYPDR